MSEKRECRLCGRLTTRWPRTGKRHYPHLCPHGVPCTRGDAMLGWHANRPANAGPTHCPKCCEEFDAREAGLIDWRKFPPYFTQDSIERGIFKPESETHATPAQIRSLLSDAEYYADSLGPDQCPAGLVPSARRVIEHCRRALNGTGRDSP